MADTEDYLEEATPTAHKTTHQNGGTDEISLAGLSGEPAQLAAHALLPTVHQDAPDLILTHKGDAAAHHAKYTDAEAQAIADAQIAIHADLATVHQDAPDLILTHKGDASAHHAKYTDAEARAAINDIFGSDGKADADIDLDGHDLKGGDVLLPNGAFIGIGAALERLEFYTAGYAAFMGCKVGFDTPTPDDLIHLVSSAVEGGPKIRLENTNPDQWGPLLHFRKSSDSPADDDELGGFYAYGKNSAGAFTNYCQMQYFSSDITDGDEAGKIILKVRVNDTLRPLVIINGYNGTVNQAEVVINQDSLDCDFRVEAFGITNALEVTGSNGDVNIGAHDGTAVGLKLAGNLVTSGAADSGGPGYKLLRVPN